MDDILKDLFKDAPERTMNLSATLVSWIKGIPNVNVHISLDITWSITYGDFWFLNSMS